MGKKYLNKKMIVCLFLFFLLPAAIMGCNEENKKEGKGRYTSISDLSGKRIGVQMGSIQDTMTREKIDNVEFLYFSSFPDMVVALKSDKIDAFPSGKMVLSQYMATDDSLTIVDGEIGRNPAAYLFPKTEKGKALRDQMNEFLAGLRESGELDRTEEKWCARDESGKTMIDYTTLPDINGKLTFLTEGSFPPYSYVRDGLVVGYDPDIAVRFCKEYGYALDIVNMNFEALLPAIAAGKGDFAASGIAITEERKQTMYFSDPNIYDRIVFAVLKKDKGSGSFLQSMSDSFRKTFITENRYLLILKGIANTLIINISSLIFGTLLGFALYLLCRNGNVFANKITGFFAWLIRGMPGVVLLMLLYYVIFGNVSISGLVVSVIAFSLTFGIAMYGMLVSGVKAVDRGQTEAAYALGFNDRDTFFHLILPQAAQHFMPAYKGEIVALIKASAIVGYVTVEDLTRMGDIIRSRTYEPFFPIISVAVIYFILSGIILWIANRLMDRIDYTKRSEEKILKGIKKHD